VADFVDRLARALLAAPAGGFLSHPPSFDGRSGLGIPGISGIPRPRAADAVVSAQAPELQGDEVHFFALPDGVLIVDEDEPDGALTPLADAIEAVIPPSYRAEGLRRDDRVWAASAIRNAAIELPSDTPGELIEVTRFEGERQLLVDGERAPDDGLEQLDDLAGGDDFALRAERLDETWWAISLGRL
jgi:hypothetical protein